jgi:hypothetical protein
MSKTNNKNRTELSGISIALAFSVLGLAYSYWLTGVYGIATKYVGATLILVGGVALLIESQKLLKNSNLRFDNGGVGLLLLVPTGIGAYYADIHLDGWVKAASILVLSIFAIFGLAGFIDLIVSVFEGVKSSDGFVKKLPEIFKLLTLLISSAATIIVALQQI